MGVGIEEIKSGAAKYIDKEILSSFPETSPKRIIGGASAAIFINNKADKLIEFADALGLLDEDGNIELETFKKELESRIGSNGMVQYVPGIGNLTFEKEDINKIYNYIVS